LGQKHVDEDVIAKIDRQLDADARKQLLRDVRFAPVLTGVKKYPKSRDKKLVHKRDRAKIPNVLKS